MPEGLIVSTFKATHLLVRYRKKYERWKNCRTQHEARRKL